MKHLRDKLYNYMNNLNFQEKVRVNFLLISLIPLCILGTFSFIASNALLIRQQTKSLESTLIQTEQTLDKQFNLYNKIIRSLCFNKQLITIAHTEFTSDYDKYEQLNFIDELFIMTQNLTPGIDGITFYTDANISNHGSTVLSIEKAKEQDWYQAASPMDTTWYDDGEYILCIRPVLSPKFDNNQSHYIVMRINYVGLAETLTSIDESKISAVITDSDNEVILNGSMDHISAEMIDELGTANTEKLRTSNCIALKKEIPNTGWSLIIASSYRDILASTLLFSLFVLLMIFLCLIAVRITSRIFSQRIVHRIHLLRENMREVEKGILEVTVTSTSNDEIGELIQGFSNMVTKINRLIEENYIATIEKKDYELRALQAQINPHFLYNSLSLINWRALRLHATEISEMAQLLSTFYRTTLNKGNSVTTVSAELLNVKSYLQIQLIMHSHEFEVEYQVEESTASYSMPNLMLQPLVENAIVHGLENTQERGKITISCLKKKIIFSLP